MQKQRLAVLPLVISWESRRISGSLRVTALDALKEMRLLIFELRPPVLEKEGLEAALQARLDAVEGRAGLKTELNVTLGDRLPGDIEDAFYRIAQEALNNVLKHAQARRVVEITLTVDHSAARY